MTALIGSTNSLDLLSVVCFLMSCKNLLHSAAADVMCSVWPPHHPYSSQTVADFTIVNTDSVLIRSTSRLQQLCFLTFHVCKRWFFFFKVSNCRYILYHYEDNTGHHRLQNEPYYFTGFFYYCIWCCSWLGFCLIDYKCRIIHTFITWCVWKSYLLFLPGSHW